jgi:hypothetical protein
VLTRAIRITERQAAAGRDLTPALVRLRALHAASPAERPTPK